MLKAVGWRVRLLHRTGSMNEQQAGDENETRVVSHFDLGAVVSARKEFTWAELIADTRTGLAAPAARAFPEAARASAMSPPRGFHPPRSARFSCAGYSRREW